MPDPSLPTLRFLPLATALVRSLQAGGPDAYGRPPERRLSDGDGVPCRHCLAEVPAGRSYLVLALRPFATLQPYAETGPVFLCAEPCPRHPETDETPTLFRTWPRLLLRGYDVAERIVYGSGTLTSGDDLAGVASRLLARPEIAFLHLRSATNGCFQCRIERAEAPATNA